MCFDCAPPLSFLQAESFVLDHVLPLCWSMLKIVRCQGEACCCPLSEYLVCLYLCRVKLLTECMHDVCRPAVLSACLMTSPPLQPSSSAGARTSSRRSRKQGELLYVC